MKRSGLFLLLLLTLATALFSLGLGRFPLSVGAILAALGGPDGSVDARIIRL